MRTETERVREEKRGKGGKKRTGSRSCLLGWLERKREVGELNLSYWRGRVEPLGERSEPEEGEEEGERARTKSPSPFDR
jgi:hypothetical protein